MIARDAYLDLDPVTAHGLVRDGHAILIDIREAGEHALERIPGAALYPLSSFTPDALPQGGPAVILHCGSGKRSATAMAKCRAAGVPCYGHVEGGIMAWKAAGLPTAR
ncbi:rhodanese-like domain-containing protein [Nitrospirillum sp. BR 11752]|uniref:rhodanese-like domain-containing protein n=1 Tax=Nitrospirillum sp. BR 11752 TaxID=3104293 RepID=UPI002EBB43D8|nr:rhodanese-like domain-containing protein [Nitrospirillum sp. BR 11752]